MGRLHAQPIEYLYGATGARADTGISPETEQRFLANLDANDVAKWSGVWGRTSKLSAVQMLALAVLEHAVLDFNAPQTTARGRVMRETELLWLGDASDRAFSFRWCCDVVGLQPSVLRAGILRGTIDAVCLRQRVRGNVGTGTHRVVATEDRQRKERQRYRARRATACIPLRKTES